MTEKVKVSREVAEAIEKALNYFLLADGGEDPEEALIVQHAFELHGEVKQKMLADVLFELGTFELAEILVNGYEVELTPEEKVLEYFNDIMQHVEYSESKGEKNKAGEDALNIIRDITTILGHVIKGVNA